MVNTRRRSVLVCSLVAVIGLTAGACGSTSTEAGPASTTAPGSAAEPDAPPGSTPPVDDASPPGTTAVGGDADLVVVATPYGDAIGTTDGLVLYTWDLEADGTIACLEAECVEKWPPLLAEEVGDTADLDPARVTLVERPDGTTQVAIDARPLYHMAVDEPGEATCQGAEGWWILNPDGTKNTNETRSTTTTAAVPGY